MAENQIDVDRVKSLIKKGFVFGFLLKQTVDNFSCFWDEFVIFFYFILHAAVESAKESPSVYTTTKNFLVKLKTEISASPKKVKQVLNRPDFQCDMALLEAEISFQQRQTDKK